MEPRFGKWTQMALSGALPGLGTAALHSVEAIGYTPEIDVLLCMRRECSSTHCPGDRYTNRKAVANDLEHCYS